MKLNLFGFCGNVSGNTVFVVNQVLDVLVLIFAIVVAYTHNSFNAIVSEKYEKHVRRLIIVSLVSFAITMIVNLAIFMQRRVSRFGNNVAFLSAKIALYIFVLSIIVLDYVYNEKKDRLLSNGAYIGLTVIDIILLYLSALGLKACDGEEKDMDMCPPEVAMDKECA